MSEDGERQGSAGRGLLWTSLVFEHEDARIPVEMQLWLDRETAQGSSASISFEGSEVLPVRVEAASAVDALSAAIQQAEARLSELRGRGWRIVHHQHGYGLEPFDIPLAEHYRFVLEEFGAKPDAEIISGPTPRELGDVVFVVRVENRTVTVSLSADGVGCDADQDLEDSNIAMRLVSAHVDERPQDEKLEWYKQAARLRRAAGKPRPFDFPRLPHITVSGEPIAGKYFVELAIDGVGVAHRILFSHRGGVSDECAHWPGLAEADRNAAFAAAIDYAFAHPEKMRAAGLDMEVFGELYG